MKKLNHLLLVFWAVSVMVSCQPDSTEEPQPSSGISFTGTWKRDSVLVNEVAPNGTKTRTSTESNSGTYTFLDDNTGILNESGSDFAITWNYDKSKNIILISEPDWAGQSYSISQPSTGKVILTGQKDAGGGYKDERILYLTRK